jgi:hypothetical protein
MSINKFGFNEDYGIYCMSLTSIARERREAAEAEAKAAIEKREAINSVFSMIADALSYLDKDIPYLTPDEISDQFFHSLVEVNNVPVNIVEAAANDYLDCRDCSDTVKCALESMIDKCCKSVE